MSAGFFAQEDQNKEEGILDISFDKLQNKLVSVVSKISKSIDKTPSILSIITAKFDENNLTSSMNLANGTHSEFQQSASVVF